MNSKSESIIFPIVFQSNSIQFDLWKIYEIILYPIEPIERNVVTRNAAIEKFWMEAYNIKPCFVKLEILNANQIALLQQPKVPEVTKELDVHDIDHDGIFSIMK